MIKPANINPHIVEMLYSEALLLADEVRAAFQVDGKLVGGETGDDLARIALSCEGLRTTTRMMHTLAWLLNRRAHFSGDLSEFQLRRHGNLPSDNPSDPEQLVMLSAELQELVQRTEKFHARIARLDRAWREKFTMHPAAIHRLHHRLGREIARR